MTKSFSWKPEISGEANVANFYERQNTSDCCSPRQFQFLSEFPQLHKYALWSLCNWLLCFSFVHRFAFQPANPWSLHKILTKYLFLLQLLAKYFLPKMLFLSHLAWKSNLPSCMDKWEVHNITHRESISQVLQIIWISINEKQKTSKHPRRNSEDKLTLYIADDVSSAVAASHLSSRIVHKV